MINLPKKANLIIYRLKEKGLEVFLVNSSEEGEAWDLPKAELSEGKPRSLVDEERLIALDPVTSDIGDSEEALAVEGDWHDIPSLKNMLQEDAMYLKDKLKEMEKGTYFAIKEAFKKVLPHQYEFLKELKDIIVDRNSIKNM